jgi:transposase
MLSTDESRASVARRLGVNETTARNWVADHLANEAPQTDPLAVMGSEFEELRPFRREVAELRTEREILRMAAASTTGGKRRPPEPGRSLFRNEGVHPPRGRAPSPRSAINITCGAIIT